MITVCALYHFTPFDDPDTLRGPLLALCEAQAITGTILLAREGINGTVAGSQASVDKLLTHIRSLPGCAEIEVKFSPASLPPFTRMKVRLKREIVTMGQPDVDPRAAVGHYLAPGEWNDFITQDDVVVIDTRNDYEVEIGTFRGAVDPGTKSFRDFPAWWAQNAARFHNKRIAMFCTGGIRCEKSTNYLISQGIDEVYHLKGGILKYLEETPEAQSLWDGACFVFDERVSVEHGLREGPHVLCRACRRPLAPEDTLHPDYEVGVSCRHCIGEYDDTRRAGFRERQKQIELARARGTTHLGPHP